MLDYHLAAKDGVQGTVQDFLFDDESWIVQYLVVETVGTLLKSKVLISPLAVGRADLKERLLPVLLTCEQILSSPPLEADMPITRQRESGLKRPGCHLRSMREVLGYSLHTADGEVGNIDDFIIEYALWSVHYVVVALKHPSGHAILVRPESIRSISWPGKAAWLNITLPQIMNSPEGNTAPKVTGEGDAISPPKL
jgi:hypothetical protein